MAHTPIIRPPQSRGLKAGIVLLRPGEEVGEHCSTAREEIIVVLDGTATVFKGRDAAPISQGMTHFIGENVTHNVKNLSDKDARYIYVVSPTAQAQHS